MYAGSKKVPSKWSRYTCWAKTLPLQSYGSEGLQLVEHSEIVLSGQAMLQLTFDPGAFGRSPVTARCQVDHPFYVKNKGGSSDDDNTRSVLQTDCMGSFTLCFIFVFLHQAGRRFTQAWPWCVMGYRAMKWRWEYCAFLQDTEMPNTLTTHLSLTHSGGKLYSSVS